MPNPRLAVLLSALMLAASFSPALAQATSGEKAATPQAVPPVPPAPPEVPEVQACKATGLLALQQRSPAIKDIVIDPDTLSVSKAETKIEDTTVRTIVIGDAYLERAKTNKPHRFVCLIGEKGRVLLTFFTQQ